MVFWKDDLRLFFGAWFVRIGDWRNWRFILSGGWLWW